VKTYTGSPWQRLDPDLREAIAPIDRFLRDLTPAFGRITGGEVPDGSGRLISAGVSSHHELTDLTNFDDHSQYLYLSGRAGGQTVLSTATSDIPLMSRGFSGQTADLFQALSSAGVVLAGISAAGDVHGGALTSDTLHLRSNSFDNNVARIQLTSTTDVIFDVPAGSVDPLTLSLGTVSGTLTGTSLTVNLVDTGGNNSTLSIDNRGGGATPVALKVFRATAGSTANQTEWRDEANNIMSRIKSDGAFVGPISTTGIVEVTDSTFSILDNATPSKIARFECATITAGNTRTYTFPDASGTLALLGSTPQVYSVDGTELNSNLLDSITVPSLQAYLLTVYMQITTGDGAAGGNLSFSASYSDAQTPPTTQTIPMGAALPFSLDGTHTGQEATIYASAGTIDVASSVNGVIGSAKYALHFRAVRLGA